MQSRRDDLESLGYLMIYFGRGSLPWEDLKAPTEDERKELVKEMKMNIPIRDLCGGLPNAFTTYFEYVRTLKFDEQPNYSYLRRLFHDLFVREGFQYDHVFDWTMKKFSMMYDQPVYVPSVGGPSRLKKKVKGWKVAARQKLAKVVLSKKKLKTGAQVIII